MDTNQYPVIAAVCCFHGRHKCVERVLRHFLDQDYKGKHYLLLYNNAPKEQRVDIPPLSDNKIVILINNYVDRKTGIEYTNTGDIFRDAVDSLPADVNIVCWMDSDDSFLPTHISSGREGMKKAKNLGCLAYKPYYSYFLYENRIELMHNTLEPSIFVDYQYIKQEGFHPRPCSYHQLWLDLLITRKQLFTDPDGQPTLLYNWEEGHGNHKISGMGDEEFNFEAHRKWETDYGQDGILTPCPELEAQYYYRLAKKIV